MYTIKIFAKQLEGGDAFLLSPLHKDLPKRFCLKLDQKFYPAAGNQALTHEGAFDSVMLPYMGSTSTLISTAPDQLVDKIEFEEGETLISAMGKYSTTAQAPPDETMPEREGLLPSRNKVPSPIRAAMAYSGD